MSSGGPNVRLYVLRGAGVALLAVVSALVGSSTPRAGAIESATVPLKDHWVGVWTSTDPRDRSNQRMTIARSAAGAYVALLVDELASLCGNGSLTGEGTATGSRTSLSGTTTLTCANGQVFADAPFRLTWSQTDTLVDGLGVVWSRARPAARSRGALPLGRLVLSASEVPGLRPLAVRAAAAKEALAEALRPVRLPRFAPRQSQISRFRKRATVVTSLVFVMRDAKAARTAATALAKAGRGTRAALGVRGYVLHRRDSAVVWYRGRIVGAVVLRMAHKKGVRGVTLTYARTADRRIERALTQTAYSRVLESVGSKGQISRTTALDLFALAFGPLPGRALPPGPAGRISDGTLAVRNILRYWKTLTPVQREAAAKLMGVAGVRLPGARWTATRARHAEYGDPNFTPDAGMTEVAMQFAAIYGQNTGFQYDLQIVAGPGSPFPNALGYATAIDDQGNATARPTLCKITITPAGLTRDAEGIRVTIAHEAFHCFQAAVTLNASSWVVDIPDWVSQGTADWAAFKVTRPDWKYAGTFHFYLDTCDSWSLYRRVHGDAVGFFGHSDDVVGDFWKRIRATIVRGALARNDAAYDAALGSDEVFLNTWASSTLIVPTYGSTWTSASPVQPPPLSGCDPVAIIDDMPVKSNPLTVGVYGLLNIWHIDTPLVHVRIERGHARISDGQEVDQTVRDSWFCLEGVCECPAGSEGTPPPAPRLVLPAVLGLTGGKGPGAGTVTFVSLEDFCKHKQPLPPVDCISGALRRTAAAGSGPCGPGRQPAPGPLPGEPGKKNEKPPDPVDCTGSGCALSAADPHLRAFGGNWYDFQAVGEFTALRSTSGELEVQVRQAPWPGSKVVAMNSAAAMRVAGDRVNVYGGQPLRIRVNGLPVRLGTVDVRLPKGGIVRPLRRGQLDVIWPDGTVVRVIPTGPVAINLVVSIAPKWLGNVTGLLGDNDGNRADDFRTRSGRVLDPRLIRGDDERAHRLLYRVYGDSWRVTPKTSLFDYGPGESTRTFTNRSFPARIVTSETLPAPVRQKAASVCRRVGLTKALLKACIVDVGQTRDYGFATGLALSQLAAREKKAPRKAPPPPPPTAAKGLSATVTYQGRTLTFRGRQSDGGCQPPDERTDFLLLIGRPNTGDERASLFLSVGNVKGDGTYTTGTQVLFEVKVGSTWKVVASERLTVRLAGKLTRGTFTGVARAPDTGPFSGSFRCR
jgi:von Willebrand factor type D domain